MNSLIYSSHAHREKPARPPISRAAHTTPAQRPADRPAQHGLHPHTPRVASSRPSRPLKHSAGRGRGNHVAPRPPGSPGAPLPPAPCLAQYAAQQARPVPARLATRPYALPALRTRPPLHTPRLPCTPGRFRPGYCVRCTSWPDIVICGRAPARCSVRQLRCRQRCPCPPWK